MRDTVHDSVCMRESVYDYVCIRFLCWSDLLCASSTSQRRRWKEKKGEREEEMEGEW